MLYIMNKLPPLESTEAILVDVQMVLSKYKQVSMSILKTFNLKRFVVFHLHDNRNLEVAPIHNNFDTLVAPPTSLPHPSPLLLLAICDIFYVYHSGIFTF